MCVHAHTHTHTHTHTNTHTYTHTLTLHNNYNYYRTHNTHHKTHTQNKHTCEHVLVQYGAMFKAHGNVKGLLSLRIEPSSMTNLLTCKISTGGNCLINTCLLTGLSL